VRSKYNARKNNGYASRLESRVGAILERELKPGEKLLKQVAITLACGAKYVCDFAVVGKDGMGVYVEAKGIETPVWRLKMRMLKHEMPDVHAALLVVRPSAICARAGVSPLIGHGVIPVKIAVREQPVSQPRRSRSGVDKVGVGKTKAARNGRASGRPDWELPAQGRRVR
jgi:hypothetical protein